MQAPRHRPVWREPMVWLVAGLPLLVLLAAVATLAVARRTPADASAAPVRRIAQVQVQDLAPEREAARLGLQAQVRAAPATGAIEVAFATAGVEAAMLELALLHPLDARLDRTLALRRAGSGWRGRTTPWQAQAWDLRLQPAGGEWRLAARLPRDSTEVVLRPAVPR